MPMVWATRMVDGTASHISEVIHGLGCECICPGCQALLEAVNSENPYWKKRPHFRHYNTPELYDCEIKAVIQAAKDNLSKGSKFLIPEKVISATVKSQQGKTFTEQRIFPGEIQEITAYDFVDATDAILTLSNGLKVYVRLIATGKFIEHTQPKQTQFAEVLIDISDPVLKTANRDILRQHITLSPDQRKWCSNQADDTLRKELLITAQKAANAFDEQTPTLKKESEAYIANGESPKEKFLKIVGAFKQRHLEQLNESQKPLPLPSWAFLKKKNTSFHAFKLRNERNCWVLVNSALHDGYFIVPSPELFDGWDEALPPSLGKPDYKNNAYTGDGNMSPVDAWFYCSKNLVASNIDSDAALVLKFTQDQSN